MKKTSQTTNHENVLLNPIPAVLLDETAAAEFISTTPACLKLSRHTGELYKGVSAPPHVRCGKKVRYSRASLEAWAAALPEFNSNAHAISQGLEVQCNANKQNQAP